MKTKTILVIGATGTIGRYITSGLNQQNFLVKALVRDKEKARNILPPNIELIEGNLQNISDVEKAVVGTDGIFINLNIGSDEGPANWHPLRDGIRNLLVLSKFYKVQHLQIHNMLSRRFGINCSPADWKDNLYAESIELVKNSGLNVTIFNCSLFYENFYHALRQRDTICIPASSTFPMFWISAYDFGKQAARAFFHPEAVNTEFTVQGTESYTLEDAAKLFVSKKQAEKVGLSQVSSNLLGMLSRFKPKLMEQMKQFESIARYEEKFQALETWRLFGAPHISLSDFSKEISPTQSDKYNSSNLYREPLFI